MRQRGAELGLATLLIIALSTEGLSAFHALGLAGVSITWGLIAAMWVWGFRGKKLELEWDWFAGALAVLALGIWLIEGLTGIVSPPNSSDAMAYHMPRVIYWIQQRSVEFFATPYLNQIMLQPLHEYVTLHFQLVSGGDRFANCVSWLATGGYIMVASLVAQSLGAAGRGQALAAFLAATLPNGILQASGAKNEALLSFALVSMVYFALRRDKWIAGIACGLGCFTKGTAFLFSGPLLLLLLPSAIPHAALAVLFIHGPFLERNYDLSGSPLGFDSAQADGKYRWRNDRLGGWQPTASNLIRHLSEQLGSGSAGPNQQVFDIAVSAHRILGLDENDSATTWPLEKFRVPRKASHETDANNRWHLGLLISVAGWLAWKRDARLLALLVGLALGALLFCFYLKWQPFMARMWLPLFVLSMCVAAVVLSRARMIVQIAVCALLLDGCRLPLLKSWIRPLMGPGNMFQYSREDLYFNDMKTWDMREKYQSALDSLHGSSCRDIGMDINQFQLEYPIQALMLKDFPNTRFVHVNTQNPSRKYEHRTSDVKPCITICLACDRWIH